MQNLFIRAFVATLAFVLAGCATASKPGTYKGYETPSYEILRQDGAIEIRRYAPMLVAEVVVTGDRKEAANAGFRQLAGYIFGDNKVKGKIDMTSPVTQRPEASGSKIAMTSPVVQSGGGNQWVVQFTMPKEYTLETLPAPENPNIRFRITEPYQTVSIRFSGFWGPQNMGEHREKLDQWIATYNVPVAGAPWYAFYDSPFTLPWNRRNEIHYRIN